MIRKMFGKVRKLDWWKTLVVVMAVGLLVNFGLPLLEHEIKLTVTVGTPASAATPDYTTDGVDDDVQILAAIAALPATGGEVLLLTGTYNISNPIVISSSGVILRGLSRNAVVINANGVAADYAVKFDGVGDVSYAGMEQIRILNANSGLLLDRVTLSSFRDLVISGNDDVASIGLKLDATGGSAYYNHFENVNVENFDDGTHLTGAGVNVPTDNTFVGLRNVSNLDDGLWIELGIYNVYINPRSSNNGGDGYDVDDSSNMFITSYSEGNTGWGYNVADNYNTFLHYHAVNNIAGTMVDSGTRNVNIDSNNQISGGDNGVISSNSVWFSQMRGRDTAATIYFDTYDGNNYDIDFRARNTGVGLQPVARLESAGNPRFQFVAAPNFGSVTRTISGGVIDADTGSGNSAWLVVDTQGAAASDDLDTISGAADGDMIVMTAANATHTVVAKDGTGNIQLAGGADFSLDDTSDILLLFRIGSNWYEICRADNG